jgi:hypothetical protein
MLLRIANSFRQLDIGIGSPEMSVRIVQPGALAATGSGPLSEASLLIKKER